MEEQVFDAHEVQEFLMEGEKVEKYQFVMAAKNCGICEQIVRM